MTDIDVWWSAYLAVLAAGYDNLTARAKAQRALEDYKHKAAELNE